MNRIFALVWVTTPIAFGADEEAPEPPSCPTYLAPNLQAPDDPIGRANRVAYQTVLELAQEGAALYQMALSRCNLGSYTERYNEREAHFARAVVALETLGEPSVAALADIAADSREAVRPRKVAAKLLCQLSGAKRRIPFLLEEAGHYLEAVLHDITLNNQDPDSCPIPRNETPNNGSPTVKALVGWVHSDDYQLASNWVSALGQMEVTDESIQSFLLEYLSRFIQLEVTEESRQSARDMAHTLLDALLICPKAKQSLVGLLINQAESKPDSVLQLVVLAIREGGPASEEFIPVVIRIRDVLVKDLNEDFIQGTIPTDRLSDRFDLGRLLSFISRQGSLPPTDPWHPIRYFRSLASKSRGRPFNRQEWFYLQVYADLMCVLPTDDPAACWAWELYYVLIQRLIQETKAEGPFNFEKNGTQGPETIFRVLNYVMTSLAHAPANEARDRVLKGLLDEGQFGWQISWNAKRILKGH